MQMRSFTDYLRSVDDDALLELFTYRADLISPVPSDIASLAVRACSAPSLARAIDALNQWQFQVLEACAVINEPFNEKQIIAVTDKAAAEVLPELPYPIYIPSVVALLRITLILAYTSLLAVSNAL